MSHLIVIRSFFNHVEADIAKSVLETAGIDALVQADDAGGVQPGLWAAEGVQLLVREEDADDARQILDSADENHRVH
jgi:Putative prokaryotic signal transducing protein